MPLIFLSRALNFTPFIPKKKKKKEKESNNKKLNKEAGTLRVNRVSYDNDTDLITKRDKG